MSEITLENANELILKYFGRSPYKNLDTGKNDATGAPVFKKIPCDVPSVDGFCAEYDVAPSRLAGWLKPETVELCLAKFKNIMMVNGTNRGYDAGFSSLVMKNVAGWAEKSEVNSKISYTPGVDELRMLQAAGFKISAKLLEGSGARV